MSMDTVEDWIRNPGAILRQWRKEKHLTLANVSEATGISVSHLSEIERGKQEPSLKTFRELLVLRKALNGLNDNKEFFINLKEYKTREEARS